MSHPPGPESGELLINNRAFYDRLEQVRDVKKFLFEEKADIDLGKLDSLDLRGLNQIRYSPKGRPPTLEEWYLLDKKQLELNSLLDANQRRKIRIRELGLFFGFIPLLFLMTTVIAIFWYMCFSQIEFFKDQKTWYRNAAYLAGIVTWAISQGGLGACAFIGTRVISRASADARNPETRTAPDFDVGEFTDRNYLRLRIVLGCLFGFLLGFPVAEDALTLMLNWLYPPDPPAPYTFSSSDVAVLFVPFLAGFSNSLVLAILNRFVSAAQVLFGVPGRQGDESRSRR